MFYENWSYDIQNKTVLAEIAHNNRKFDRYLGFWEMFINDKEIMFYMQLRKVTQVFMWYVVPIKQEHFKCHSKYQGSQVSYIWYAIGAT